MSDKNVWLAGPFFGSGVVVSQNLILIGLQGTLYDPLESTIQTKLDLRNVFFNKSKIETPTKYVKCKWIFKLKSNHQTRNSESMNYLTNIYYDFFFNGPYGTCSDTIIYICTYLRKRTRRTCIWQFYRQILSFKKISRLESKDSKRSLVRRKWRCWISLIFVLKTK